MKKLLPFIVFSFLGIIPARAAHITGGEVYYTLTGVSGNDYTYHVVLKLFRDCGSNGAPLDNQASIGIFEKAGNTMIWNQLIARTQIIVLQITSPDPCITNPPTVCYQVGYYEFDVTLPGIAAGYTIAFQRCCRIPGINNLVAPSGNFGTTYTADIPGTGGVATGPANNSAKFVGIDTVIVCAASPFTYSFAAFDADGDELSYTFCNAYHGGGQTGGSGCATCPDPNPPVAPPYNFVSYASPYSGFRPMGTAVNINPTTGLISGVAPPAGIYVVTVCVTEKRNGVVIAQQRKDLQIKVGDCTIAEAELNPRSTTCDGFTMSFQNDAPPSPLINSYFWDFGTGNPGDTSNLPSPTFTFPDTGVYIIKLVTNRNQPCSDSATTPVKIYPGFFPGFVYTGSCFSNPFSFTDTTRTSYGVVDSWTWEFGDPATLGDTSHVQNPFWTYASAGPVTVRLIVTNSKGCIDTADVPINVLDKPALSVAFNDTLICRNDAVQLQAIGTGNFSWTPPINISGANTATPTVSPTSTQWYYVDLDQNGCLNRDSVRVRVVNNVSLMAMADTTICEGDTIQLFAVSDGLSYSWTPAANLNNPNIINPIAVTGSPTNYTVVASIGSCTARDDVFVNTIPYPGANAGPDMNICYNTTTQLNASINGIRFTWTPTSYLSDPNILNPVAFPPRTTQYILSAYDTLGCPKPGRDTLIVIVNKKIIAFAGRDTTVVINQPLQFQGTGGTNYFWSPSTGLNNVNISNPVGVYGPETDSIRYKLIVSDSTGCADSAYVTVYVFKTSPYVFVPTAFTPNNDGLNDVVRPIAVGIKQINYFVIYNRWGERVYYTTANRQGWNGSHNGKLQGSGVFVWMVSAVDYLDRPFFLKGTVTLIR
jgi:gliding motility-associated-like protein